METQKTVIQAKPVTLSSQDQEAIITFVKDCETKGRADRTKYIEHAQECENAYHCRMPTIDDPELDWMSNECLPWAYDSADSWKAHIHTTTIPKLDQIFTISGRTEEEHPGADIMQKYLDYRFERNKFRSQLGKAYDDLKIKNHACLKVYWRTDTTVEYKWQDEPVMGMVPHPELPGQTIPAQIGTKKVRKPNEVVTFNNVWIDIIDLDNFVMYPIRGDINKTTRIHTTYRHYEDLMASADKKENNYFNLDKISLDDEKESADYNGDQRDSGYNSDTKGGVKGAPTGLKIKEAWIYRLKIGEQVYRNYVATIVNDKTVIRFQPFPPGSPRSPFIMMALRPDGDCFYGYGLNSKGLGILRAANKKFNGWIDEGVLTQHGAHKYYDDGVFNPNNVVRRPGAMIKLSREGVENNLLPLSEDPNKLTEAMTEMAALKVEFESVTVPKVVKGMIETGADHTATEISQAQNNSNGKMHIDAFNINDDMLLPTLELTYEGIYERAQWDEEVIQDILKITAPKDPNGNPLNQLPLLPLPEVDIKIVGYQNVIRKQQQLQGMGQAMPMLMQSPAGKYLKWYNIGEDTLRMLDLDTDRLYENEDQAEKIDEGAKAQQQATQLQAHQNQQLLIQKEATELMLKKDKQDQDYHIKCLELELQRIEIEAKYAVGGPDPDLAIEQQDFENITGLAEMAHKMNLANQQQDMAQQDQAHQHMMAQHAASVNQQQADTTQQQADAQQQALQNPQEEQGE